jgi:hypothetical protein
MTYAARPLNKRPLRLPVPHDGVTTRLLSRILVYVSERLRFVCKPLLAVTSVRDAGPILWQVEVAPKDAERSKNALAPAFPCVELQRLKQKYDTALRIWGRFEFPLHNEPVGPAARQAERLQLKQKALKARNEASERLLAHREKCRICVIEAKLAK